MSASCCEVKPSIDPRARKALWIALFLNASMFTIEVIYSFIADSVSLKADALDFLGDSANYAISLYVLSLSVIMRARASQIKGITMGLFGIWVILDAANTALNGGTPHAETMTIVGVVALLVNALVAFVLYRFRNGDSNMQSVWLCTRNDIIGNLVVILAAAGVYFTQTFWPDIMVAALMSFLSISASLKILKLASIEMRQAKAHIGTGA